LINTISNSTYIQAPPIKLEPRFNYGVDIANQKSNESSSSLNPDPLAVFLKKLGGNSFFRSVVDVISGISLASLFGSSFAELKLLKFHKETTKKISSFANYANKTFQILNSIKNITSLYPRKDLLNAFGHAVDIVVPFFAPMKDFYLWRGLPLGLYVGAHAVNIVNEKEEFASNSQYLKFLKKALNQTVENFNIKKPGFWSRYFTHKNAMMGVTSSLLCLSGVGLWRPLELIFGKFGRSVAAIMRDSGGFFQAFEGMKPGHIASGRIFFGLSGHSQFLGALANMLAETVLSKYKAGLDPLSFALSSLGRWLYRISNDRGEAGLKNLDLNWENLKAAFKF
jgi:hypothetical protein